MDDEPAVSQRDCGAGRPDQLDASCQVEIVLATVLVDGKPVDKLEHEVRSAVLVGAAIKEASDVRMLESGQNLAFTKEPFDEDLRPRFGRQQLERHLLVVSVVGPHGPVDRPHAAATDLLDHPVGSDPPADRRWRSLAEARQ